jgi:hypothetical protein
MTPLSPDIRRIALEQFTQRRAFLKQAAQNGDWPGDPANEAAQLWLAIALAAGVGRDLPADVCAMIEIRAIHPYDSKFLPRADQIAPAHAYRAELARARAAAIAQAETRGDPKSLNRARDLIALAEALGAPAIDWTPTPQRTAA